MSAFQFGLVSSTYTVGGFVGAVLSGPQSTRHGRLCILRAISALFFAGPLIEAAAGSVAVLAAGRLVSGLGAGGAIVVAPIYVSEIAPVARRGVLGAATQVMTNVGILVTQVLGYFLSWGGMWRLVLAVAAGMAAVQAVGLAVVLPESPVWLTGKGEGEKARKILRRLRGEDVDVEDEVRRWVTAEAETDGPETGPEAEAESAEQQTLLPQSSSAEASSSPSPPAAHSDNAVSMVEAIKSPIYRPAIISVIAVMLATQFTGINSIIMYSVSLLSTILPSTSSSALLAIFISTLNLVTTISCAPLSDLLGRKRCLLLSITGTGAAAALLAAGISLSHPALCITGPLVFVAFFAVGLGPIPFALPAELVADPHAVGAAQSWALAANWAATAAVAQFFPVLNEAMGGKGRVFWVFVACAVAFGGFVGGYVPETRPGIRGGGNLAWDIAGIIGFFAVGFAVLYGFF